MWHCASDVMPDADDASTSDGTTDNGTTDGYIPAMDAVFTQTATLENSTGERFAVTHSEAKANEGAYAQSRSVLSVALEAAAETKAVTVASTRTNDSLTDGEAVQSPSSDNLQLNAVPASEAKSDFDMGADGVKWISATAPSSSKAHNRATTSAYTAPPAYWLPRQRYRATARRPASY